MNINENKRVVLLASLFGLAFAGIMYKGYSAYSAADESTERLNVISAEFENYNAAEFPPTSSSFATLRKAYNQANALNKELKAKMDRYATAAKTATQSIKSPVDFQNAVNKAITDVKKAAEAKKVKVGPGAVDLGMGNFKNTAAIAAEVPYRAFLLAAIQNFTGLLIDSEAVAIDKIYCANLPKEADTDARRVPEHFPLRFEVSFTAKRGTLNQVLNSIPKDNKYFFRVTGLSAESDISLPSIQPYEKPRPSAGASDDAAAPSEEIEVNPLNSVARPMTGLPTETVRVHLNMEVLYFSNK